MVTVLTREGWNPIQMRSNISDRYIRSKTWYTQGVFSLKKSGKGWTLTERGATLFVHKNLERVLGFHRALRWLKVRGNSNV